MAGMEVVERAADGRNIVETIECIDEGHTPEIVDAPADVFATYTSAAISKVAGNKATLDRIRSDRGIPWMGVQAAIRDALPDILDGQERDDIAHKLVQRFMDETFGKNKWSSEKRPKVSGDGLARWIYLPK